MVRFLAALLVVLALLLAPSEAKGSGRRRVSTSARHTLRRVHLNIHSHATMRPATSWVYGVFPEAQAHPGWLDAMNRLADANGVPRALTDEDLGAMVRNGTFVELPRTMGCFSIDERLIGDDRTLVALRTLVYLRSMLVPAACGHGFTFTITSLARSRAYQCRLARYDPNAVIGCRQGSIHETGLALDITTRTMGRAQMDFLLHIMRKEEEEGALQAFIFEMNQNHFHVIVRFPDLLEALAP